MSFVIHNFAYSCLFVYSLPGGSKKKLLILFLAFIFWSFFLALPSVAGAHNLRSVAMFFFMNLSPSVCFPRGCTWLQMIAGICYNYLCNTTWFFLQVYRKTNFTKLCVLQTCLILSTTACLCNVLGLLICIVFCHFGFLIGYHWKFHDPVIEHDLYVHQFHIYHVCIFIFNSVHFLWVFLQG